MKRMDRERAKAAKKAARLEANQKARLAQAKMARRFIRETDAFQINITMRPGAPAAGDVVELQFDISKKLERYMVMGLIFGLIAMLGLAVARQ